jgi:hypothetical protein
MMSFILEAGLSQLAVFISAAATRVSSVGPCDVLRRLELRSANDPFRQRFFLSVPSSVYLDLLAEIAHLQSVRNCFDESTIIERLNSQVALRDSAGISFCRTPEQNITGTPRARSAAALSVASPSLRWKSKIAAEGVLTSIDFSASSREAQCSTANPSA